MATLFATRGFGEDHPTYLQALEQALLQSYLEQRTAAEVSSEQSQERLGQTPPASAETIRTLPLIELREADLVDPVNRECCVCLEDNRVGDKAVRMPHCCHTFHKECIVDWLRRKCTCPTCRYEHPTDNLDFEEERLQRKIQCSGSKPRLARHELERMPYTNLVSLLPEGDGFKATSSADMANHLIQVGAVDIINIPEPEVEYSMSALQKMSVVQLRKCMSQEAGVYCINPKEVTKKEDLIQVFLKSGRIRLLPENIGVNSSSSSMTTPKDPATTKHLVKSKTKGLRGKIRHFFATHK